MLCRLFFYLIKSQAVAVQKFFHELLRLRHAERVYRFEGRFGGAVEFGVARLFLLYTFYIGAYFVRRLDQFPEIFVAFIFEK